MMVCLGSDADWPMIPGAMIGLVLCVLLNRHADAGLVAAFAADKTIVDENSARAAVAEVTTE